MAANHSTRRLLVEGKEDYHVILHLCALHAVAETFRIQDQDGIDVLLEALPVQLKASDLEVLGVVVDADLDLPARWQALRDILTAAGYAVPPQPHPMGTILRQEDRPRVGVWIMPDNLRTGMLEDFAADLIPAGDRLWSYACECVAQLPEQRFPEVRRAKANLHTWLAWQEEPGKPLGTAITAHTLDAHAPAARQFVQWLQELFSNAE